MRGSEACYPMGSSVTVGHPVNVSQPNVTDMEIEPNFSEFEVLKPVKSSAVVNQFDSVVQREVKQSLADMEVCSNGSSCANVIRMKQPVVNVCFDASAFGEVNEVSHNPSSRSTLPMTGESGSVSPVQQTAFEARRKLESMINEVRSQAKNQLTVFSPVEFESTPVSTYPRRGHVDSEVIPEVVQSKKGEFYRKLDDEVLVRHGVSGQPVRVTPRQPNSQSLLDPEAPTRCFGSSGQRQVTVVKRGSGNPEALVTGGGSDWSWSSVDQLDKAVSELIRGRSSQSSSSQASLSAANVEAEDLSQSAVNEVQQPATVSLPLEPITDKSQSSAYLREPSRPACRSAPPFESRVDQGPPARRRVEFPVVDGAVYRRRRPVVLAVVASVKLQLSRGVVATLRHW